MTDGRCTLCGDTYTKQGMTRHLRSCKQEQVNAGDQPTFHLRIGDVHRTDYWIHVGIEQEATLATLDDFLRDIWLECCGHMSSFTIDDVECVTPFTDQESMLGFGVERRRQGNESKITQVINRDRSDADDGSCKQSGMLVPNASGDVRCGDPNVLNHQHNPQWLGDGRVLVADSENNRVVELTRQPNGSWRPTWALYRAGGFSLRWPRDADRLPNGNTLITDSLHKRVVEVTPAGDVVWSIDTKQIPYSANRLPAGETGVVAENQSSAQSERGMNRTGSVVVPNGGQESDIPVFSTLLVGVKAVFPLLPYWFAVPQLVLSIGSIVLVAAGVIDRLRAD